MLAQVRGEINPSFTAMQGRCLGSVVIYFIENSGGFADGNSQATVFTAGHDVSMKQPGHGSKNMDSV